MDKHTDKKITTPVEYLDATIAELKEIQLWNKHNNKGKNIIITQKISYCSCVREFLLTNTNINQLGRLGGIKIIAGVSEFLLLEESNNKDLKRFIRMIDKTVFDNRYEYMVFKNNMNRTRVGVYDMLV